MQLLALPWSANKCSPILSRQLVTGVKSRNLPSPKPYSKLSTMKTPGRTCWTNDSSIPTHQTTSRELSCPYQDDQVPPWPIRSLAGGESVVWSILGPGSWPRPPDLATQITFNRSLWPPISDRLLWNDWHNPQSAGVIKRSHWVLSRHKPGVFTSLL